MESFEKTSRNTVKRIPKRGHYDKETIFQILDNNYLCHISFSIENQPYIIPTAFGRKGDILYFHGATTSRMLQYLEKGLPASVAVTNIDALVLARSAFHHSMNYHAAILFGTAKVAAEEEKIAGLKAISDQILQGRWEECRPPSQNELKATKVLSFKIESASAKIRAEGVKDDKEDLELPYWAGLVPIESNYGIPIRDKNCLAELPDSIKGISTGK
jgi:nitroimidazol reductase NimA-like FMN-containing flavoprotein (pyridoxamine 5'-phosphate oxidase superfamily)